jgi:dephospho-CoA kinase
MKRDGFSIEEATRRIDSQMPQDEKRKFADYLIDTSGSLDETQRQALDTFKQLKLFTV